MIFSMVLSMVGNNAPKGIASKCMDFIRLSRLQNIDLNIDSIDKSAISRARTKVSWEMFRDVFYKAVKITNQLFPQNKAYTWNGFSVYAIDGSKYTLPASKEIREAFDPTSGFENEGKGHYPQCLVTTIYDVYRRIPVARSISEVNSSERNEFLKLFENIPNKNSLFVFDRGYPSYEMFNKLSMANVKFLFRCPTSNTFKKVQDFLKTGKNEEIIEITIEYFHSKSYNGIMQEFYAICILNLITRLTSASIIEEKDVLKKEPQFKNALITFAANMTIFTTKKIIEAAEIFIQIAHDILCVKYYKENKKNKSQPRVIKRAISKFYYYRRLKLKSS